MTSLTTSTVSDALQLKVFQRIATELGVGPRQVTAAVALLDEGSTVPFIARYRKEATGNLDDTQLRTLEERLLVSARIGGAPRGDSGVDRGAGQTHRCIARYRRGGRDQASAGRLYLPYKPKRRTRAQIAREAGLEPLADALLRRPDARSRAGSGEVCECEAAAEGVEAINVPDAKAALDGARDILVERFAETAELLAKLRTRLWEQGVVTSKVVKGKETAEEEKFRDYYAYAETDPHDSFASRAGAVSRPQRWACLTIELGLGDALEAAVPHPCVAMIAAHFGIEDRGRRADKWLAEVCALDLAGQGAPASQHRTAGAAARSGGSRGDQDLRPQSARAVAGGARRPESRARPRPRHPHRLQSRGGRCDRQAAGDRRPSIRTSRATTGRDRWRRWPALVVQHGVELISIGNGTASRETDKLATEVIKLVAPRSRSRS